MPDSGYNPGLSSYDKELQCYIGDVLVQCTVENGKLTIPLGVDISYPVGQKLEIRIEGIQNPNAKDAGDTSGYDIDIIAKDPDGKVVLYNDKALKTSSIKPGPLPDNIILSHVSSSSVRIYETADYTFCFQTKR